MDFRDSNQESQIHALLVVVYYYNRTYVKAVSGGGE